jgi:hypothetical protein
VRVVRAGPNERLRAFERDFAAMVARNRYRRYLQAEFLARPVDYAAYFGLAIYAELRSLKRELDPRFVFGGRSLR